ncbi:hypothetical protein [Alkalihalobacillus urbisdiaboli]|uniref:hypothetical protein n=1 Tax=Halalkalibacter urbisdiaboli TaxID=1960589 RepID=UPI000B453A36
MLEPSVDIYMPTHPLLSIQVSNIGDNAVIAGAVVIKVPANVVVGSNPSKKRNCFFLSNDKGEVAGKEKEIE